MQVSLAAGDDESTISLYTHLTDISYQLQLSACHHLVNYLKETIHFWHSLIKDKLSKYILTILVVFYKYEYLIINVHSIYRLIIFREYNDILKTLKWPFCGSNINALNTFTPETLTKFKLLTEYLLHLQLPYPFNHSSTLLIQYQSNLYYHQFNIEIYNIFNKVYAEKRLLSRW